METKALIQVNLNKPLDALQISEKSSSMTIQHVMLAPAEQRVQRLARQHPEFLFKSIGAIIAAFLQTINVKQQLTSPQVIQLTEEMIVDNPDWSIWDFVLFFRNIARGKYGPLYDSIDQAKIMGEFRRKYEEERSIEREKQVQTEKQEHLEAGNFILNNKDKLPVLAELMQEKSKEQTTDRAQHRSLRDLAHAMKQKWG